MKIVKKIFKWGGITLVVLLGAMVAIPYFFKDTIKEKVIEMVNKNLKANLSLADVEFPKSTDNP